MKHFRSALFVSTVGLCLMASESGRAGQSASPSPMNDGRAAGLVPVSSPRASSVVAQLAGRYAHYDVVAYVGSTPLGEMRSLVISYGFTRLEPVGSGRESLESVETFCHAEQKTNLPMKTTVPDAFTRAIAPRRAPVELGEMGGRAQYYRPETPTPIGIRLTNPSEVLPTDPTDPRIVDDDGDGKPGVTVFLKLFGVYNGELYLARRERFAYLLTKQSDGRLTGRVFDASEQLVLGAKPKMLAKPNSPVQASDGALSPIVLVPVDDALDCDGLMEQRDAFFPPEPKVW